MRAQLGHGIVGELLGIPKSTVGDILKKNMDVADKDNKNEE